MKQLLCLFTTFVVFTAVAAADTESRFIDGTIELSEGNYENAVEVFESLAAEHPSAQVYYNLALAQQQLEAWGSARLNYERALVLDPRNREAQHNLNHLLASLGLESDSMGSLEQLGAYLSLNSWTWIAGVAFWLWLFLRILDHYDRYQHWSATLFRLLAILVFASACTFAFLQRHSVDKAIILDGESQLRVAPTRESPLLRDLIEADKVRILAEHGSFYRIRLSNGDEGFVINSAIAPIIPALISENRQ
ncbi:MAG: hypothetical protein JJU20_04530 [Opitutales bacterium]|nr:hypothetical protein [Opitutales bacterium]